MSHNTSINPVLEACKVLGQKNTLSGPKEPLTLLNDIIIHIYKQWYTNTYYTLIMFINNYINILKITKMYLFEMIKFLSQDKILISCQILHMSRRGP